ncbi:hypothetical protein MKX01_031917 [Papaver californicum]|nr:hypothetical protein MKX01_031917 [Papaver californicum]
MQQQVNFNPNAPPPQPPPNHRDEVVRRFISQKPEAFKGNADPLGYEECQTRLRLFTLLEVNGEDKLTLAIYKLEGEATRWWEMTRRSRK